MTIQASTGLRTHMLDTGSLRAALDDGILEIYDGVPPAGVDDAVAGTLLVSITDNSQAIGVGNGIDFEPVAVSGVISKETGQVWAGTIGITGTASYYRIVEYADRNGTGGGSSTTAKRIQGTVGLGGGDLNLDDVALVATQTLTIAAYVLELPNG